MLVRGGYSQHVGQRGLQLTRVPYSAKFSRGSRIGVFKNFPETLFELRDYVSIDIYGVLKFLGA